MVTSEPDRSKTFHSSDRTWWWDGWQWLPAFSPDMRYWFNGIQWVQHRRVRHRRLRPLDLRSRIWLGGWATILALYLPILTFVAKHHVGQFHGVALVTAAVIASVDIVSIPAIGLILAVRRALWLAPWVWLTATGAVLFGYVLAMVTASDDPGQDDAAGAGLAILAIPTTVIVGALVGIGVGCGIIVNYLRSKLRSTG